MSEQAQRVEKLECFEIPLSLSKLCLSYPRPIFVRNFVPRDNNKVPFFQSMIYKRAGLWSGKVGVSLSFCFMFINFVSSLRLIFVRNHLQSDNVNQAKSKGI